MVAVLVLGPKPQPLLVLLLWFFGSVFSRATWDKGEMGDKMLGLCYSSAATNICSCYPTLKRIKVLSASLSVKSSSWSSTDQHHKKGEQCVATY